MSTARNSPEKRGHQRQITPLEKDVDMGVVCTYTPKSVKSGSGSLAGVEHTLFLFTSRDLFFSPTQPSEDSRRIHL